MSAQRSVGEGQCALSLTAITKRYPGILALDSVDLEAHSGEVHAIVGENGAGKSTLIKSITGAERPDGGSVSLFGQDITAMSARDRRKMGIATIYQELSIVPDMTAEQNVFLDAPPRRGLLVDRRAMRSAFAALCHRLGIAIAPDAKAGSLSIADRQMIEIMRALRDECRLLIMDEPTAALGQEERARLLVAISDLRSKGVSILYISHDLKEIMGLADRVSVMRNGRRVATAAVGDWTREGLVAAMIGGAEMLPKAAHRSALGSRVLSVSGLTVPGYVSDVSFDLHQGEILGIAGLVGSGRSEILRSLAGADKECTGRILLGEMSQPLPWNLRRAVAAGVAFVPEDRKAQGISPRLSAWKNVWMTDFAAIARAGVVDAAVGRQKAAAHVAPLGFASARLDAPAGTLSGGNQQKIVIGKWLHKSPRVLLLDEPTRGVDVRARAEIYASIRQLAETGLGVLLVSSDLEEITEHADRVLVLSQGRIVSVLDGAEATPERMLSAIFLNGEVAA